MDTVRPSSTQEKQQEEEIKKADQNVAIDKDGNKSYYPEVDGQQPNLNVLYAQAQTAP